MEKNLPVKLERETLLQLAPKQQVEIIIEQAIATERLNKRILQLEQEVQKLRSCTSPYKPRQCKKIRALAT